MARYRIIHEGSAAGVHWLVSQLKQEGLEVEWEPPRERRDLGSPVETVVTQLIVRGDVAIGVAVLDRYERHQVFKAKIEVDEDEDDDE